MAVGEILPAIGGVITQAILKKAYDNGEWIFIENPFINIRKTASRKVAESLLYIQGPPVLAHHWVPLENKSEIEQ